MALISALIALWSAAACRSAGAPKDDDLQGIVERFHHDLRWKYNQQATGFVDSRFAADYLDKLESLNEDLNIIAWDLRKVVIDQDGTQARVRIHLRYYLMPSTVVKDECVEQDWRQVEGTWVLMSMEGGPIPFPPKRAEETDAGMPSSRRVQDLPEHADE